ncbi:ATPase [Clostridium sp. Cult3]|uniref:ATPase n=1 Tax=Clostridium sp. Cult3 TaxID=2079004 RepID=UPI001F1707B4|nr:ATPase [Clostridium sp. Cult3]MCF6459761.1 ATPase [Clostridium sp. Cult3]
MNINNYSELDTYVSEMKSYISKEQGKKEKILEQIQQYIELVEQIESDIDLIEKVSVLLQSTSEFARNQAKLQVESLVTNCLQYIFENNAEFEIEIEELYGKPNAEFYVLTKVEESIIKTKPELSRGGGVVDIISLALRIAFLQIYKPTIEGPLILDEPAKHVSEEYIFNVADFLMRSSELFNRQIIMVTHNNHLSSIGTRAYKVYMKGTESQIEEITPN